MGKLSDTKAKNAKPHKNGKERVLSDGDGLCLRVRKSADGQGVIKTWIYRYRRPADGKGAKLKVGEYPGTELAEARAKIPKLRKALQGGIDPQLAQAADKAEEIAVLTMGELFKRWIDYYKIHGGKAEGTIDGHIWRWEKYLERTLKDIRLPDLTRAHLSTALDVMRKKTKIQTGKAITTLRLMLDYARVRHMIEDNPARMIRPEDFNATRNPPRKRALSLDELRAFWRVLDSGRVSLPIASAFKLLILTGARRDEVVKLTWKELDLKKGIWVLPGERAKNGQEHTFYLSAEAVRLLESMTLISNSEWVFESDRKAGQAIHKDSLTTALQRLQGRAEDNIAPDEILAAMQPFTVHDLRRSAATAWGEHLKIQPHIIERMLNHLPENQLIATYQRASYAEEQRQAWAAWGEMVESFVARDPENVVSISSRKGSK